ncbi:pericentriolar material 1 protein-like isoform X1 [Saccostrea cucullata]|uniref:pericentriolar material 1 protein-like isoform X1 n=1 Tax=Saccostrea cuccullata TaxID=36930 RepID=UPI002ED0A355
MATGGHHPFKTAATDPRPRGGWQRTTSASDKDDNFSNHSNQLEHRPNNWDFSDWKPRAPIDNTKRRKKGNPEREREQSLCLDSPPPSEKIRHTPSTYPRTRITPSTPTSQRVALENLRQQLTFSDQEDQVSNDSGKNNERNMPSRRANIPNFMRQDVSRSSEELAPTRESEPRISRSMYSKSARDETPTLDGTDGGQIVGRLMQIRDYIKQAKSMMDAVNKSGSQAEDVGKLKKLLENLQEQEKAYLSLLQQLLSMKEDSASLLDSVNQRDQPTRPDTAEDTQSVEFDLQSETSEATTSMQYRLLANTEDVLYNQLNQGRGSSRGSRPQIEERLGMFEVEDQDERTSLMSDIENALMRNTDSSPRQELEWEDEYGVDADVEELAAAGGDVEGLQALLLQEKLLKKLKEQQEQMQTLKGRQAALLAIQKDAEKKLAEVRERGNQASRGVQNIPVEIPVEINNPGRNDSSSELNSRRNYLRNEFKEQNTDLMERQSNPEVEAAAAAATSALEEDRQLLKDKLKELQDKKQKMDTLLHELNSLRNERSEVMTQLNNASANIPQAKSLPPPPRPSASGVRLNAGIASLAEADQTAAEAQELQSILEAREKLQKLQEVKERLNQLRGLVQYYQTSTAAGEIPAVDERTAFQNMIEGYGQGIPAQNIIQSQASGGVEPQASTVSKSDEDNRSQSDSSESESNLSSLGPWGDDPEIQEKVRKLKAAKEKLKQLQGIVSMVQHTPDAAQALPDSITELAATLEVAQPEYTEEDDKNEASEGEVPNRAERDSFYEAKMQEQLQELEQLRDERQKLLAIQQELQSLHDRFTVEREEGQEEEEETEVKTEKPRKQEDTVDASAPQDEEVSSERTRTSVPVVTFSSNDEVYGKMRKQRMLREELRQKKRELEAIMKKDGSRKQYGKNQDNQSDTVSYTTDAFGVSASADATMATWGGSTVDNLESITEDDDGQQGANMEEEEDDGYPSDGILQVEEEEEENDSDNNTYTIENDVRQRRQAREQQRKKIKSSKQQTFPRSKDAKGARPKSYRRRMKQENYRAPEDIIQDDEDNGTPMSSPGGGYDNLQQQLERTATLCQNLLANQSSSMMQANLNNTGFGLHGPDPNTLQQQLQQQQLMLTLNQCLQQITMQQVEMQNMQRQMQNLSLMFEPSVLDPRFPALQAPSEDPTRYRSHTSLPSGLDSRGLTPNASVGFNFQPRPIPNRSNENLLLSEAAGGINVTEVFAYNRPEAAEQSNVEQHRRGVRNKSTSVGQSSADRSVKRKTSSLSDRGRRQTSQAQQSSFTESPDVVPPLNLQEILRRKKMQGQNTQSEWSTMSLASSKHGENTSPDSRSRGQRGSGVLNRDYRPGLSAGISGAGFQLENSSIASTVSNRLQAESRAQENMGQDFSLSNEQTEFSLFETLRESIYSEVASLISQNENRPHFLIELFRELQVLTTDYLRQRVLYSIRDIVSKHLTEQASTNNSVLEAPPPPWMNAQSLYNYTASELTPSESLMTEEEEEVGAKAKTGLPSRNSQSTLNRGQSLQNNPFDYEENADNDSSLSTPSNSYWDSPFNQDYLGDTVINLDKALARMREYDRKIAEGEANARALTQQREQREQALMRGAEPASSSAVDQGSESSFSSMSYPKIDTQQLDHQIKGIMKEVIPVIKENMDSVCSTQLLAYIKRLVLSLARQGEDTQYSRFFSNQMSSTLQDTLAKYEGRKMRQCGEDLLVDMSEALFNELAFFKLMEGLGEPASYSADEYCSAATQTPGFDDDDTGLEQPGKTDESDTTETVTDEDGETLNSSVRVNDKEEEENLGKARDDALANEVLIQDSEDKDDDSEFPYKTSPVQIELAPSETKPFTRIGSDEDDEDADESQSADDPSDTAVSHLMECSMEGDGTVDEDYVPDENDEDQGARSDSTSPQKDTPTPEKATPTKDSPAKEPTSNVQVNGHMEEENEITVEDLPTGNLNVSKEQIENKMNEEQQSNGDVNAILSTMDGKEELAGDGQFLKEPPTA